MVDEEIKVGDWVEWIDIDASLVGQMKMGAVFKVLGINDLGLIDIGLGFGSFSPSRFKKCSPPEQENKSEYVGSGESVMIFDCPQCAGEGVIIFIGNNSWVKASEMVEGVEYECKSEYKPLNNFVFRKDEQEFEVVQSKYRGQILYREISNLLSHAEIFIAFSEAKFRRVDNGKT